LVIITYLSLLQTIAHMDDHLTNIETEILIENLTHYSKIGDVNSYSYIKNTLDQLFIPFPAISIKIGKLLFRSRRHLQHEIFFNKIPEISYREDIFNITQFGRANEPCQSIFYCSDRHEIAIAETSPIIRNDLNLDFDILTTGIWEVKKELRIASLLNYPLFEGKNLTQKLLDLKAKKLIESFRDKNTPQLLKLLGFFSNEFGNLSNDNPTKYLISCAFANYIYSNTGYDTCLKKKTNLDGIIYPSTIYPDFGMNLALLPKVIFEGKLNLIGARKSILNKINETKYIEDKTIDTNDIRLQNNQIIWNEVSS
jgi:RES domain